MNLHLREKPIKMKPTLNILATANASRGENTVKLTTTILKQIIKEELAKIEEGPTPVQGLIARRFSTADAAKRAMDETTGASSDDYEVVQTTAYRVQRKS